MMTEIFLMELDKIQPSQLYISSRKLNSVMKNFASKPSLMEPIPVKKLGDRIVFVDGHTRAFAALLHRFPSSPTKILSLLSEKKAGNREKTLQ